VVTDPQTNTHTLTDRADYKYTAPLSLARSVINYYCQHYARSYSVISTNTPQSVVGLVYNDVSEILHNIN